MKDFDDLEERLSTEERTTARTPRYRSTRKNALFVSTNFPLTHDNRTMHVGTGIGEIANRIITVSDTYRAERLSHYFDDRDSVIKVHSERGITTFTGKFRGTDVTVISTGIGISMMDFIVRESTYHLKGNIAMVRLGTCGLLDPKTHPGSVILNTSSRLIQQNYDFDPCNPVDEPYCIVGNTESDPDLCHILQRKLVSTLTSKKVRVGANLTAESFYSAQGRVDPRFEDYNDNLVRLLTEKEPEAYSFDLETFKLLHLASRSKGRIKAAACVVGTVNRVTEETAKPLAIKDAELFSGFAVLQSLIEYPLHK